MLRNVDLALLGLASNARAQPNNLTNEVIGITFMTIVFFASIVVFFAFTDNVLIAFMHGGIDAAVVLASPVCLRSFAFKYARNVFAVCLLRALYNGCMCTQFLQTDILRSHNGAGMLA